MDSNSKKPLLRASGIAVLLLLLSIAVVSIKGHWQEWKRRRRLK